MLRAERWWYASTDVWPDFRHHLMGSIELDTPKSVGFLAYVKEIDPADHLSDPHKVCYPPNTVE